MWRLFFIYNNDGKLLFFKYVCTYIRKCDVCFFNNKKCTKKIENDEHYLCFLFGDHGMGPWNLQSKYVCVVNL